MPRKAREKSESEIYHVMIRGINQQQIFEDDEDKEKFIQVLRECKAISEFKLFAYCLMSNHIHLLIKVGKEDLGKIFKRIGGRYVYWYNIKYQRNGHLFQDRFKSEPVKDDKYFLTVIRYIHQNPIKAKICNNIEDYNYSSYGRYVKDMNLDLVDIDYVYQVVSKDEFLKFNNENSIDKCLDIEEETKIRLTDEQAKKVIERYTKCKSVSEFQRLEIADRDKYIKILKEKGISIRQLSRLTGISYYIIQKA